MTQSNLQYYVCILHNDFTKRDTKCVIPLCTCVPGESLWKPLEGAICDINHEVSKACMYACKYEISMLIS